MAERVAIVGIGYLPPRAVSPELSYKEMTFEAARKAYHDAGIGPEDVGSFVCCAEDICEGTSITDEYAPDQLGAVQRPVQTITGDGLHGIASAVMQLKTGLFDVVLVESHSKASNILDMNAVIDYSLEPVFNRPLGLHHYYIAGLQMRRYLHESGASEEDCAAVVVKNRLNALKNPGGVYGRELSVEDVLASRPIAAPLKELDAAGHSDCAAVAILATEEKAKQLGKNGAIWLSAIGWNNDSPNLECREWAKSVATELAAGAAYKMAGISSPADEIDLFEVDDTFSYKELAHIEALGLCEFGQAGKLTGSGQTAASGKTPVNPSGGCLGTGHMLECTGLYRLVQAALQLRGEAGQTQVPGARRALVQSWRGVPTETCCVCVIEKD